MAEVNKGIISSIEGPPDRNGDLTRACILPSTSPNMPTRLLVIPWHLRGKMADLKVGDIVAYALFDDLSGIILERIDGEWTGFIPGSITVAETVIAQDATTSSMASANQHTHANGNNGADTGPPTG